jgi:transporter family protein
MGLKETLDPVHARFKQRVAGFESPARPTTLSLGLITESCRQGVDHDTFGAMTWITWSLLSAFFAAATAILAKLGVKGVDANVATAVRTSVVVVFTWLLAYITRRPTSFQAFSRNTWVFLIFSGLATGLSWLCYFHALQIGPASRVAPIDKLSVALVILFGALFLGEQLTWGKGLGGFLIVAGAIIIAVE